MHRWLAFCIKPVYADLLCFLFGWVVVLFSERTTLSACLLFNVATLKTALPGCGEDTKIKAVSCARSARVHRKNILS